MDTTYVRVGVGGEQYAVPVEYVHEVAHIGTVTPVPGVGRPFLGVCNLRGEVLPIVDFGALVGVPGATPEQMVVTQAGGLRAGLAVEHVLGVGELPGPDRAAEASQLQGAMLIDGTLIGVVDVPGVLAGLAP
jgi:purine-binding chemotaxis protein CheW